MLLFGNSLIKLTSSRIEAVRLQMTVTNNYWPLGPQALHIYQRPMGGHFSPPPLTDSSQADGSQRRLNAPWPFYSRKQSERSLPQSPQSWVPNAWRGEVRQDRQQTKAGRRREICLTHRLSSPESKVPKDLRSYYSRENVIGNEGPEGK